MTMGHKYTRSEREGGMIDAYLHTKGVGRGGGSQTIHSYVSYAKWFIANRSNFISTNKVLFSKASVERASQKFKDTCTR